jgi:hypothetical protein
LHITIFSSAARAKKRQLRPEHLALATPDATPMVQGGKGIHAPFAWLISHQPAVLFSQNKPATSNQPAVLFSQNKPAPAISHQPTEQAVRHEQDMIGGAAHFSIDDHRRLRELSDIA